MSVIVLRQHATTPEVYTVLSHAQKQLITRHYVYIGYDRPTHRDIIITQFRNVKIFYCFHLRNPISVCAKI